MNFKSSFLTLSMKEQICLAIIFLSAFSATIILLLCCSFCYEVLKEDYYLKKYYFYDKYKEIIEITFYFQNFCLLQYEEILKRMQHQMYKFHRNSTTHYTNLIQNYAQNDSNEIDLVPFYNTNENKNISENNDLLFFFCFNKNIKLCEEERNKIKRFYDPISSLLFSHDISKYFNFPGYNVPIVKSPLFVNADLNYLFSFNGSLIYDIINKCGSDYIDINTGYKRGDLDFYFSSKVGDMKNNVVNLFLLFLGGQLFFFENVFEKASFEIVNLEENSIFDMYNNYSFYPYVMSISGYYTFVKFPSNHFSFISTTIDNYFYYFESYMIDNYLYFIHNKLSDYLDISFIPLHYENNTIISPELCLSFLLKQYNYQLDENKINEIYKTLIKGESNITDCFINKNFLNNQTDISNIFDLNISHYMSVGNILYQGIINTYNNKYPYYFIKYTYPNFNSMKEFKSNYILLDQVNFYLFAYFKDPILFSEHVYENYKNVFILIIIIILYTWILCLVINLCIFNKVIIQLTDPIKKLQEAIESSSIKDENIFKYDYDIFINDLFLTCKELLSGQIDNNNNEKGLGQFNILSIPKDKNKNIDKNLYQRNLIINNDIMNQLINEQQNMMDFSKNIKINDIFEKNNENNNNNNIFKKKINFYDDNFMFNLSENIDKKNNNKDNDIKNNNNKHNKNNEEKEREPYKKLFQISEYLYYYQNKVENNYWNIVNNVIKDESKNSNISKISSNINVNGSLKINNKLKKPIIRGDSYGKPDENDNISINMLNNKNITYLWYMEAKKRKNKSINYNIGKKYNELFNDYNNYQSNNNENIKKIKDLNL